MEDLMSALRLSVSQITTEFAPAAKRLEELERSNEDYHRAMLEIALNIEEIEPDVRLAAVLQIKNGVERRWRSYCSNALNPDVKTAIKEKLFLCLHESVPGVARQFAYVISRVARHDYPDEWPQIIPDLLSRVQAFDITKPTHVDKMIFLTLRMTLTELASRQLMSQRSKLHETCQLCLPTLMQAWSHTHQSVITLFTDQQQLQDPRAVILIDINIDIEKSLRRIARRLCPEDLNQLVRSVVQAQQGLCTVATTQNMADGVRDRLNKTLLTLSKIVLEVLDGKSGPVEPGLTWEIMEFCRECVMTGEKSGLSSRYLVNCMNQIKQIVQEGSEGMKQEWTSEVLCDVVKCLVFDYLPLSESDLALWDEDIVDFCTMEIGESWKYNIRPSAEVLFMTLLREKSAVICPMIFETIDFWKQGRGEDCSLKIVIMECAIYKALSLSASELFDSFDFEDYFQRSLVPRVQQVQAHPYGKIIHRAVLQLLDAWTDIKPFTKNLETTWQFIAASLDTNLDFAVRFAAANTLRQCMLDFDMDCSAFVPHEERSIEALHDLLEQASEELQMRVLDVFNTIMERIAHRCREQQESTGDRQAGRHDMSFMGRLVQILESIWKSSKDNNMLKCSLVVTMTNVVESSNQVFCQDEQWQQQLHRVALPMVHTSCNLGSDEEVYLMLDGLELWSCLMRHATQLTPDLLQLFALVLPLLEYGFEEGAMAFKIAESYLLVGGASFVEHRHFTTLSSALKCIACAETSEEVVARVVALLETSIHIDPVQTLLKFGRPLVDVCRMGLGDALHGSRRTSAVLLAAWVAVVADHHTGIDFLRQLWEEENGARASWRQTKLLASMLDQFVEMEHKKVAAMAMTVVADRCLLTGQVATFKKCLKQVVCCCVQIMYDVCDESGSDEVVITDGPHTQSSSSTEQGAQERRSVELMRTKLTHRVALPTFVRAHLLRWSETLQQTEPLNEFLAANVDPLILNDLEKFMNFAAASQH